ncbi:MAG: hypothetical protein ACKPA7_08130, partial [Sphaerospermopsis kisseleviana]
MRTVNEVKILINREMHPVKASDISRLVKAGLLPETKRHLEDQECTLRSVSPWRIAYHELRKFS